ncbi:MAG: Fur family transcriptional regulator [Desulfuromonadaceae bacterium]
MVCPKQFSFQSDNHDHQRCIRNAMAVAEKLCRRRQQRFTPLRRRVLQLIWQQQRPVGAYDLLKQLQQDGKAAPITVYRVLDFLLRMGLVHRILSQNAYIGCVCPEREHAGHFLICQTCKGLVEVVDSALTAAIVANSLALDFQVRQSAVEILGLCPRCAKEVSSEG